MDSWVVCKLKSCSKKSYDDEPENSLCDGSEKGITLLTFFIFGLVNNFAYVVFLTGAEKMIPGNAPMVLLAEMLPTLAAQGIAPFFIERIPFWMRMIFISGSASGAFLIVALCENIELKFLGIVLGSISSGFGEITYMALSSGYHKNTVSMYSSGTGGAGLFGSLTFLGLSTWVNLPSKTVLLICCPVPLAMAASYFFLLPEPLLYEVLGTPINSSSREVSESEKMIAPTDLIDQPLTFQDKIKFQATLFRYTGPLFLVYFAEYLANQGVFSALVFPTNSSGSVGIHTDDQYTYYQFFYQTGVFISRSSVNVVQIKALWTMALWQAVNFALLFSIAYWNYVPSIIIVFVIVIYEGLLGGAVFVNGFYLASEELPPDKKEYGMSSISVWYSVAILLAGGIAIPLAPWLGRIHNHTLPNHSDYSLYNDPTFSL